MAKDQDGPSFYVPIELSLKQIVKCRKCKSFCKIVEEQKKRSSSV